MALRIGELVALIRADDTGIRRGLSDAEMRLAGFQRDTNGRLRDIHGRFITEGDAMGRAIASGLSDGTDEGVRQLRTRLRDGLHNARNDVDRDSRSLFSRLVTRSSQAGDSSGTGFGRSLLSSITQTLRQGISTAVETGMNGLRSASSAISSNPYVAGIGAALAAAVVATAAPLIGALLSGAVIAVSGIGIIGLGAALLKNEPEVKSASKKLTDTVKKEFTKAAQPLKKPLVEAIKSVQKTAEDVAPQISQAFETVAKSGGLKSLTDGLDKLVKNALPGFNQALTQTGPVFEGLEDLLASVGKGIGGFFKAISSSGPGAKIALQDIGKLIEGVLITIGTTIGWLAQAYAAVRGFIDDVIGLFQYLYDVLVGHSIVPDMIDAIIAIFVSLPRRAGAALASLGSTIVGVASKALSWLVTTTSRGVNQAVAWLAGLPGRAWSALSALGGNLRSRASSAGSQLVAAIKSKLSEAVSWVRGLPGRAKGALGNLTNTLYNSGRSLVSGFISGITSKISSVRSAVSSVVSAARDYFPFSPAKKGPFSGRGWTEYSGRALIDGFQRGIGAGTAGLTSQLNGLPGMQIPGTGAGAGGAAAGAGAQAGGVAVTFKSDGSKVGSLLLEVFRQSVDVRGGNVQFAVTGRAG